jgi:uncharacterized protein YbjT (DUF2867 family)
MATRTALLLGATGLVGGHLLRLLLEDAEYTTVTVMTRRPLGLESPKLVEVTVDFSRPETYRDHLAVDDVFCCLGTTIKTAGSQEAFRKVDLEYPLSVAQQAAAAGAGQFLIVTAVGASAKSRIFYNRVKGELEDALRLLSFPRGLKLFHPSMILGERNESRPGERVIAAISRATTALFVGGLRRFRAIEARDVAHAMWAAARRDPGGARVYEGAGLFDLVGERWPF